MEVDIYSRSIRLHICRRERARGRGLFKLSANRSSEESLITFPLDVNWSIKDPGHNLAGKRSADGISLRIVLPLYLV